MKTVVCTIIIIHGEPSLFAMRLLFTFRTISRQESYPQHKLKQDTMMVKTSI